MFHPICIYKHFKLLILILTFLIEVEKPKLQRGSCRGEFAFTVVKLPEDPRREAVVKQW
jgi:hypothetical protein